MIKRILLRIAYWINKKYGTIEIKFGDLFKFNGKYYIIDKTELIEEIGKLEVIKIKASSYDALSRKYAYDKAD